MLGFLHELDITGKQNLEAASRKMVLNKSADLISKSVEKTSTCNQRDKVSLE